MHGRFPLGDNNHIYQRENEHEVGIRCWLTFHSWKDAFRWEIDEIYEGEDSNVVHVSF